MSISATSAVPKAFLFDLLRHRKDLQHGHAVETPAATRQGGSAASPPPARQRFGGMRASGERRVAERFWQKKRGCERALLEGLGVFCPLVSFYWWIFVKVCLQMCVFFFYSYFLIFGGFMVVLS